MTSTDNTMDHRRPMQFLTGRTWRGTFAASTKERPLHDVLSAEQILNDKAVRLLHSINDGVYGGETLVTWDADAKNLVYVYITSAGFYSRGVITSTDDGYVASETVIGNANGTTRVEATTRRIDDGRFVVTSRYLTNDEWVPGHEVKYEAAPPAPLILP